jgi:hypothetical protein
MRVRYVLVIAAALPAIIYIIRWFAVMIGTLARGPGLSCPKCGSKRTRRSMPRLADMIFPAFVLPRRCENCKVRFFSLASISYPRRARAARSLVPATADSGPRRYFVI